MTKGLAGGRLYTGISYLTPIWSDAHWSEQFGLPRNWPRYAHLKISTESTADRQVFLQVELEEEEIESHKQKAYKKLVQTALIPGFRRGKAPRRILERYLGAETFMQEGLEDLLEQSVSEAVEQESLDAVAPPEITEVESFDPIKFKATVPLKPVTDLGDYRAVRVPWEEPELKGEEVEEALENMRRQGTPWEPAEGRPAQVGDLVTLVARGVVPNAEADADADAEPRVFIEEEGMSFPIREGASWPVPGFAEELVGLNADTDKAFTLTVPDDHANEDLRGKDVSFTAKVSEIKEQRLPDMDDEWAKGVMDGFDTMEALRERVETDLRTQSDSRAAVDYEEQVLDALQQQATIEFAPIMVESEIDHILQDQDERMRQMGVSLADYAARTGQEPTELRESTREQAEKRVVRSLIVSELTERAGIEATEEEIDQEVERLLDAQGEDEAARKSAQELFAQDEAKDTIRRRLLARKSVDYLTAVAKGEDPADPSPAEEAEKATSERKRNPRKRTRRSKEEE